MLCKYVSLVSCYMVAKAEPNVIRNNPFVILQSPTIRKVFNFLPPSNLIAKGNPH